MKCRKHSESSRTDVVCRLGATGFVGGQVLQELVRKYPEFQISALVRDAKAAETISSAFPSVNVIFGSLDDSNIVADEASRASVVLSMSAAH